MSDGRNAQRVAAQAASASLASRVSRAVRRTVGLTNAGLVLGAVAVCAWGLGYFIGGRPLYLLGYGAGAVLAGCWTYGRRPLPVTGERSEWRPRLSEGETIDVDVTLTAGRRLSTLTLEEIVPPELGVTARIAVPTLEPGESVGHGYQLTLPRRGSYTLGPLVARWGDPFALTERELELAEPFEILVHPRVEPISDRPLTRLWEDPPVRPPISKRWPSGMEFYGMRQYVPGDDVRRIVWRAFGRTGQLLVREAEQGITDKIVIVLDTDRENHSAGVVSESFEAGVRTAASLGSFHFKQGYEVVLEGNDQRLAGPLRSGQAKMTFLDALARVETERVPLTEAISRLTRTSTRDAHFVIVTPFLHQEAISRLQLLTERGSSVLIAALIWDELAVTTLASATAIGAQVVEVRPHVPLSVSFRREVGAGR